MLVFFNLWAIPVGLVVLLIWSMILRTVPSFEKNPHELLVLAIVTTVVSGIAECFGIKSRVFFLPVWLVGIGIACCQFGLPGVIAMTIVGGAGIIVLFRRTKQRESQAWKQAQENVLKINQAPGWPEAEFWRWVERTLFLPILMDFTPAVCEHNLRVIQSIQNHRALSKVDEAAFALLRAFLETNQKAAIPKVLDQKLRSAIQKMLKRNISATARSVPLPENGTEPQSGIPADKSATRHTRPRDAFNPQNPIEAILMASRFGGATIAQIVDKVAASQIFILQREAGFQPGRDFLEINPAGSQSGKFVAIFSSAERCRQFPQVGSVFRHAYQTCGLTVFCKLPANTGIVVNPGFKIETIITPEEIGDWWNRARADRSWHASIYYEAKRPEPLTTIERELIDQILEKYSVDDIIEVYTDDTPTLNWESFAFYDEPYAAGVILKGSVKLPNAVRDAEIVGAERWCAALSELRRSLLGATWSVSIEDQQIAWDSSRNCYDHLK